MTTTNLTNEIHPFGIIKITRSLKTHMLFRNFLNANGRFRSTGCIDRMILPAERCKRSFFQLGL